MINQATIEEVKKRLIKTYDPIAIYLFGSYAWGKPDEDSDLDLLIVIEDFKKDWYHDTIQGNKALYDLKIPKDLLLYTKKQFNEASQDKASFCYKIVKKGKRIYARA
jgi:predicted nucleotidyltransferase